MTESTASTMAPVHEKSEHSEQHQIGRDADSTKSENPLPAASGSEQGMETLSRIATADYPKALKLTFIVVALVLSIFLVSLDMTIVATAIPRITDEFHSLDQVGWYGSAFFLTLASFQSTWGKAYKYFALKPTFLISIGIFEIGSLICAVARNSTTLIVGRAIAGLELPSNLRCSKKLTVNRNGWSWYWIGRLHNHRFRCSTSSATSIHWHFGSDVWMRKCHWSTLRWRLHFSRYLAMVVCQTPNYLHIGETCCRLTPSQLLREPSDRWSLRKCNPVLVPGSGSIEACQSKLDRENIPDGSFRHPHHNGSSYLLLARTTMGRHY